MIPTVLFKMCLNSNNVEIRLHNTYNNNPVKLNVNLKYRKKITRSNLKNQSINQSYLL